MTLILFSSPDQDNREDGDLVIGPFYALRLNNLTIEVKDTESSDWETIAHFTECCPDGGGWSLSKREDDVYHEVYFGDAP